MIDSAPEVVRLAANLHENLVQMPAPLLDPAHRLGSPLTDLVGEIASEPVDPEPNTFVADVDTSLVQKVFNISKRKRKSDVHQYAKLDNLG